MNPNPLQLFPQPLPPECVNSDAPLLSALSLKFLSERRALACEEGFFVGSGFMVQGLDKECNDLGSKQRD